MNDFWKDEPALSDELDQVSFLIEKAIEDAHGFVKPLLAGYIHSGGKMLRPALVLIAARMGTEEHQPEALRIASVLELVHIASMVHDDIIDHAKTRRGIPTLYAQAGAKQAVLAGDYLLSRALSLISEKTGDLEPKAVSQAFSRLCESEIEQDAGQGNLYISERTYFKRIAGKTASLFALSCYAGAAVGQAPKQQQWRLHRIGYALGMAFQIQDDILDYNGNEEKLGKQPAKDLASGIPTLPLLKALEAEVALPRSEQRLHTLLKKPERLSKQDLRDAVKAVIALGGVQKAREAAELYGKRATRDIESLDNPEVAAKLLAMYARLSTRSA